MNPEAQILALLNTYNQKKCTQLLHANKLFVGGEVVRVQRKIKAITLVSYIATLELDIQIGPAATDRHELFLKLSKPQVHTIDNRREVDFYTLIAPQTRPSPAPACLEAVYHPGQNLSAIVLAHLGATHTDLHASYPLAPSLDQCRRAVQKLAAFHAFWWEKPALAQYAPGVDTAPATDITRMYEAFAQHMAAWFNGHQKAMYDWALAALQAGWNSNWPRTRTLVHGDAHFGNVLYPRNIDDQVVFVDWSDWTAGNPMEDLAYMLALRYFPDQRRALEQELIVVHQQELARHNISYPLEQSFDDYRRAVIKTLFVPIFQWYHSVPADVWYNNFQRITAACIDLKCMELST